LTVPAGEARFIGIPGPGIRLRPYRRAEEAGRADHGMPFIGNASGSLPYRSFLMGGAVGDQLLLPYVTILVLPDEYPGAKSASAAPGANNRQIEAVWQEAFRSWELTGDDGVVELERRLLPDAGRMPRHAPVTFCTKTGDYFEPVCPECFGPLVVCRDEARLRAAGLPGWAETLHRFLYCACCAGLGGTPVFYTFSLRPPDTVAPGVRIRRRSELYRDMAPRITTGTSAPASPHPCFSCVHRESCYPPGRQVVDRVPAEDLLVPLFYHDTPFIPVSARPFGFAEAAALIGGATADDFGDAMVESAAGLAGPQHWATLAGLLAEREQFLFAGDATGLLSLEVFYLKLAAFGGLVRGVRSLHANAGRPYLNLSPERISGQLSPADGAPLPARWRLTLDLADLITTAPLESIEAERLGSEPVVHSLPFPLAEAYLPEAMQRIPSSTLFMRMTPKGVTLEKTAAGTVLALRADLVSDSHADGDGGRHDLVRLSIESSAVDGGRLLLAGRRLESIPGGFSFEGKSAPLPDAVAKSLEGLRAGAAEVGIHAVFSAPVDVVSLGILLFRFLLANDQQDVAALDRSALERLAAQVAGDDRPENRAPVDADRQYRTRLARAVAGESIQAGADQVLYRAADRALAPAATPPSLWQDALVLALRMGSNRPGFSICDRLDEWDPARLSAPLDGVLEELAILAERARGALIGSGGRNGLLQQVCDDFLVDLEEARTVSGGSADEGNDRTVVAVMRKKS